MMLTPTPEEKPEAVKKPDESLEKLKLKYGKFKEVDPELFHEFIQDISSARQQRDQAKLKLTTMMQRAKAEKEANEPKAPLYVVEIRTGRARHPVYTYDGKAYIRVQTTTQAMSFDELEKRILSGPKQ
eukprot:TRINITY_DN13311_c0_g1_i1.p2 TRINITY_DN13311_c0_g1~~TRINITY_DN13311_c0_g1_i1.p2  ORF type:complete len:128 (-),score=13.93 TRINITY_DN13311_c0_g1_i1:77-460(-)